MMSQILDGNKHSIHMRDYYYLSKGHLVIKIIMFLVGYEFSI